MLKPHSRGFRRKQKRDFEKISDSRGVREILHYHYYFEKNDSMHEVCTSFYTSQKVDFGDLFEKEKIHSFRSLIKVSRQRIE